MDLEMMFVIGLGIVASIAGFWAWWVDGHGEEKKEDLNEQAQENLVDRKESKETHKR